MMVGDQTLPIENASGASFLQLQHAAEHCHEEGQYLRKTFLVHCSEQRNRITARTPHLAGDSVVLGDRQAYYNVFHETYIMGVSQ